MNEYISKKCIYDIIYKHQQGLQNMGAILMLDAIDKEVQKVPSADVQPVKYGKWIDVYTWTMFHEFKSSGKGERFWCSECEQGQKQKSNYCPNCGVDMRGDTK